MVLKYGSLITSGHTAGQGLPHIRLNNIKRKKERKKFYNYKLHTKTNKYHQYLKENQVVKNTKDLHTMYKKFKYFNLHN